MFKRVKGVDKKDTSSKKRIIIDLSIGTRGIQDECKVRRKSMQI